MNVFIVKIRLYVSLCLTIQQHAIAFYQPEVTFRSNRNVIEYCLICKLRKLVDVLKVWKCIKMQCYLNTSERIIYTFVLKSKIGSGWYIIIHPNLSTSLYFLDSSWLPIYRVMKNENIKCSALQARIICNKYMGVNTNIRHRNIDVSYGSNY